MAIPFTRKTLTDWAGAQTVRDAENLVKRNGVLEAEFNPPVVQGSILWNNRALRTSLRLLPNGLVENRCPCYTNRERGMICSHVIALALVLVERAADPLRERKHFEEQRRAARMNALDESQFIRRAKPDEPGAVRAVLRLALARDWEDGCRRGVIPLLCRIEWNGRQVALDQIPPHTPIALDKFDDNLLFVLEDICEGRARGRIELSAFDFANILRLHQGRTLDREDGPPVVIGATALTTRLKIDLDPDSGALVLSTRTELPLPNPDGRPPLILTAGREGWIFAADHFWPLESVLPGPYLPVYDGPVPIPREHVVPFMLRELPQLEKIARPETDLSFDQFTLEPGAPKFRLDIKGSPASLSATLHARYGALELAAAKPDARDGFAQPDPDDLTRYTVRNPAAEKQALARLAETGLRGETGDTLAPIVGKRNVLNFLGSRLPLLRRHGWQVDLTGRIGPFMESLEFATPVVRIAESSGQGWFDVGFDFEDGQGQSLDPADIQLALRKGDAFLERNGRFLLIDADAVDSLSDVFDDCAEGEADSPGHFRLPGVYGPYVKSSLDALDGVDVEEPPAWGNRARQYNRQARIEPVPLDPRMEATLRPYQKDGVYWLCFLDRHGFNGILADEMGLGKTVQTLVWLQFRRAQLAPAERKPALIVCPTSIVENWAEEAAAFVPDMTVLVLTGADRQEKWAKAPDADLAITSYAILRRDLDAYVEQTFSAVVLDEAQHIKNRSTQNSVAAKSLRADSKLVLTGTPIENSVSDLWSIMDFLMPGFLGRHDSFRQRYELPIAKADPDGELAQAKLRRKLHPFLLRRLKRHVAKDLPEKIQKVAFCSLTTDQRMVYDEILKASRRKISDLVATSGFSKARMQILAALLRLRQTCCHLGLLKLPGLAPRFPSAKTDLFFELLDEAMDGNHRVLVFSQFVSMLQLLKTELEAREIRYSYLDGSTRNRLEEVKNFNSDRSIPVFLISLKAGGVGLNLTGADTVVHFDPWWNPAVEDQATDRAHRIGQKRTVYCLKLIARHTVEEKVLALQKKKQAVIAATLASDEAVINTLSWNDIQEILSL